MVNGDLPVSQEPDLPRLHEPARAVRVDFQAWLNDVDDELVAAALRVAELMPRVHRSLLAGDLDVVDEARQMAAEVSDHCRNVEEQGFLLLAREAPVGSDLRRLVSILRLVVATERSGALLRHVAESAMRLDASRLPEDVRMQLDELGRRSAEVFERGVDAWRQRDGLAVHEVDAADAAVDRLRSRMLTLAARLDSATDTLVLGLLGRYLERIADHGVAFARDCTFAVTGERVEVGP